MWHESVTRSCMLCKLFSLGIGTTGGWKKGYLPYKGLWASFGWASIHSAKSFSKLHWHPGCSYIVHSLHPPSEDSLLPVLPLSKLTSAPALSYKVHQRRQTSPETTQAQQKGPGREDALVYGPHSREDAWRRNSQTSLELEQGFFFCLRVCAPDVCLALVEAKRGHWMPWHWRYR